MKKHIAILAIFALFFAGCGYSNWNLGNAAPKPPQEQTQTGNGQLDNSIHHDQIQTTDSGTGVVDITGSGTTSPEGAPSQGNMFHIDTIISTWGEPNTIQTNALGEKVYIWKNCRSTGQYIEKCNADSCETVPETVCCERKLVTNSEGYVTNLKQAIAECM